MSEPATTAHRRHLPARRKNLTQKVRVGNQSVHIGVGLYPDGKPGEVFIDLHRTGTQLRAWSSATAMLMSLCLQYGVPLSELVDALEGLNSEPFGSVPVSGHPRINQAAGVLDVIVRMLGIEYLGREELADVALPVKEKQVDLTTKGMGV